MATQLDDRQIVNRAALSAIGTAANATLDTIFPAINSIFGAATAAPTASVLMKRDANSNTQVNNLIENFTSTATAAGTTTLTVSSSYFQQFTGTTTQTVVLPNATTLTLGQAFFITNRSTGYVTVNTNGGSLLQLMAPGSQSVFTASSIGTSAGTWDIAYGVAGPVPFLQTTSNTDSATTGSTATLTSTDILNGVVRLTNSSLVSVSAIPAGLSGQQLIIENQTGNTITINNNDASVTAANRIFTGTGGAVLMSSNSSFSFVYDATSTKWMLVGGTGSGSGSGGSKNYLSVYTASTSGGTPNTGNGNFELGSTLGWSLAHSALSSFFPTSVATPGSVFSSLNGGTAASGNLSFTTVSSNQLAGTYSGNLASSAASVAGDMLISSAFFIDKEDQAKVMTIKAYYNANSGSSNLNFSGTSSNTFAIYVYDVTNGAWIQPAGVYGITQGSGTGYVTATFQTASNSTVYQLAFVQVNPSAGAYSFYVDDISFGPSPNNTGVIPKTPTVQIFQSGSGTYTTPQGVQYIEVEVLGGGAGGNTGGLTNNSGANGLASTFGSSLLTAGGGLGNAGINAVGGGGGTATVNAPAINLISVTGGQGGAGQYLTASGTQICGGGGGVSFFGGAGSGGSGNSAGTSAAANSGSGGGGGGDQNSSAGSGSGGGAGAYIKAIIMSPSSTYAYSVGGGGAGGVTASYSGGNGGSGIIIVTEYYYGSNVQLSSDTDTRVISAAYSTLSSTTITSGNAIIFTTQVYDDAGAYNSSTGQYKIPVSGKYKITFCGTGAASGAADVSAYVNGSARVSPFGTIISGSRISASCEVSVVAGDLITIVAGATITAGNTNGYFFIERLSGPSVIAASESVNASYQGATCTFGTLPQPVIYSTKLYDSHNAYNTSTGRYTVPVAGKYRISASFVGTFTSLGSSTNRDIYLALYKNSSLYKTQIVFIVQNTISANPCGQATFTVSANAGDILEVDGYYDSGINPFTINNVASFNNFEIERVGN